MNMLEAALAHAKKGRPVFPCRPDKSPYTAKGFKDATTDSVQIMEWWSEHPDALIGMPTGKISGYDVVDLDTKGEENGFDAVPDWETVTGLISRTQSGGAHLYFLASGDLRSTARQVAPGVDTRGEGGYVILPPSAGYTWHKKEKPRGPVPDRLRPPDKKKAAEKKPNGKTDNWSSLWSSELRDGDGRNSTAAKLCGRYINLGMTQDELREVMRGWDARQADPLGAEVDAVVDSIWKKHNSGEPIGKLLVTGAEFVKNFVPPDYLIDDVIRRSFFYSLTAPTGGGKTAIALTLSAHVITGETLHDAEVERGKVLFMAGENVEDVQARWIALTEVMKIKDTESMVFMPGVKELTNAKFVKQLKTEAEELGPFAMVIVDTSAAYATVEDENSNTEMGAHARVLRSFVEKLPGRPTVIALCHPTKNASADNLLPRGGGAFVAEVDGNLIARKSVGDVVDLHWQGKFRGIEFAPLSFFLASHRSDRLRDSKGRPIPTVVARPISDEEIERLGEDAKSVRAELLAQIAEDPTLSLAKYAEALGWHQKNGKPNKTRVDRLLRSLVSGHYLKKAGEEWELTTKGRKTAEKAGTI